MQMFWYILDFIRFSNSALKFFYWSLDLKKITEYLIIPDMFHFLNFLFIVPHYVKSIHSLFYNFSMFTIIF